MEFIRPEISGLFFGILLLMGTALTAAVIVKRVKFNVGRGDGGQLSLQSAIRAHGNFVEQALFGALALVLLEILGAPKTALIGFGSAIVLLRIISAIGITGGELDLNNTFRKSSAGITALVHIAMGAYIIFLSL